MIHVKNTFREHPEEIELFYSFLEEVINHDARLIIDPPANLIKNIKIETVAVIKSSFFLMLYNCVESTVTNCLNTIIHTIESRECKYADMIEELQKASLAAYDYLVNESPSKEKREENLKKQTDFMTGLSVIDINVKSLVGSSSQATFSGNLDVREIRKLFNRIGLDLSTLKCDEMVKIKECRNKLAHGECSFQECGRDLTIQYLRVCKDNTLSFLDEMINKVIDYLDTEQYRRKSHSKPKSLISRFKHFITLFFHK